MAEDDAFREFVTARWAPLVRTAYLYTGDHGLAEDLVQSTLERVHRHWRRIEKRHAPEAYARRVMVNLVISASRRHRFRETPLNPSTDVAAHDSFAQAGERDDVWRALRQLPPKMRAVLVLRYFEDLSEAETASILGCRIGTIKSQSSRGLSRLRELLGSDAEPPPAPRFPDRRSPDPSIVEGITR